MQGLGQVAHEYCEYATDPPPPPPPPPALNEVDECRELLLHQYPASRKRERPCFQGLKNNWRVYTINVREQSSFSGEIWTLEHHHLLLPLNRAVHSTKAPMTAFGSCPNCDSCCIYDETLYCTCRYFTEMAAICFTLCFVFAALCWRCSVTVQRDSMSLNAQCVLVFWH